MKNFAKVIRELIQNTGQGCYPSGNERGCDLFKRDQICR